MNLLKDCPEEASGIRKELLVAIRHFWNTDIRTSFLPHIDLLLNDDVLIGTSVSCRENLKALGHNVLIDILHSVRKDLAMAQVIDI